MPYTFRSLIQALDDRKQLLRVAREVDPEYEVNAVLKRVQKTVERVVAIGAVDDQYGNHRVIVNRNVITFADTGIDTD